MYQSYCCNHTITIWIFKYEISKGNDSVLGKLNVYITLTFDDFKTVFVEWRDAQYFN